MAEELDEEETQFVVDNDTIGGRVRSGEHARGRTASRTAAADGSQQSSQHSPELGGSPDLLGGPSAPASAGSVAAPVNLANNISSISIANYIAFNTDARLPRNLRRQPAVQSEDVFARWLELSIGPS